MSEFQPGNAIPEVRAAALLKKRRMWAFPLVVGSLMIGLVTLVYFGSIVDPTGHLHGLPVLLVNQDRGAQTASGKVNLGDEVTSALTRSAQVSTKLALDVTTLTNAEAQMDKNNGYATIVIPAGFTSSVLALAAPPTASGPATPTTPLPAIELLENDRSGTLGVSLAAGVVQPAISAVSKKIGSQLLKSTATSGQPSAAPKALLEDPVSLSPVDYRPLPSHAGLGLSAFYGALLVMMCGFLGATIINSSVDAGLGYATSEVGPWWRQRLPLSITRWQTLLAKWAVAVPVMLVFTGVLLGVAAGVLRVDAPHWGYLWLYGWFAASVVCIGTLVLFAALGGLRAAHCPPGLCVHRLGVLGRHDTSRGAGRFLQVRGQFRTVAPDPVRRKGHPLFQFGAECRPEQGTYPYIYRPGFLGRDRRGGYDLVRPAWLRPPAARNPRIHLQRRAHVQRTAPTAQYGRRAGDYD